MESSSYRLWIAYNGASFSGFQSQKNSLAVQDCLNEAFRQIIKQEVVLTAAGRTDSGVHANSLAVSVDLATNLSPTNLTLALATKLDKKISVFRIDKFPLGFNARTQSIGKKYIYRIYQGLVPDPFLYDTSLHIRKSLCEKSMQEEANYLIGEYDFSSFRAKYCNASHAIRYIWHLKITRVNNILEIDVRGNAFCLNIVRIIVGTLIQVGLKKLFPSDIKNILEKKDRRFAGPTAKACGLFFDQVYYPDDLSQALIPDNAVFPRYPVNKNTWPFLKEDICYGPKSR